MRPRLPALGDMGALLLRSPQFQFVREIEAFDGPILSELRAPNGGVYLEKWASCDDDTHRTLVVRSDQRSVSEYLAGRISMLALLTRNGDDSGFLVDYERGRLPRTCLVVVSQLPESYLPANEAMHDPELRPEWSDVPQPFIFGSSWSANILSKLEKLYSEVYAFAYLVSSAGREYFPKHLLDYHYDSGFSYATAFKVLRSCIPRAIAARTVGVAAASPGILTLTAPSAHVEDVSIAIARARRPSTKTSYRVLHSWSKKKLAKAREVPSTAVRDIRSLCANLGIPSDILLSESIANELPEGTSDEQRLARNVRLLKAGKVVAAYFRRLNDLYDPPYDGVEFIPPITGEAVVEPEEGELAHEQTEDYEGEEDEEDEEDEDD